MKNLGSQVAAALRVSPPPHSVLLLVVRVLLVVSDLLWISVDHLALPLFLLFSSPFLSEETSP